ncbi:strabismus domain-containing protein Vang [Dermacentor variabilis]|uniref:strabismus domain-containing protein Vang n=1 Tax=Dermacentor variabilis TaxID=34621 RepID=UPI003F5C2BE5
MSLWSGDVHGGIQLPPNYKMSHDNESVKSGPSERSRRSSSSRHHNHSNNIQNHHQQHHQQRQQQKQDDGPQHSYRASRRHSHRSTRSCPTQVKVGGDRRDEVIEVQILPQDDNWGDNTTAITGNTSERSISAEDVSRLGREPEGTPGGFFRCHMWAGTVLTSILSLAAFLSPIVMVALPRIEMLEWKVQKCGPECDGLLISFAFKLLILAVATWALFVRRPRATMPRIFILRAVVLALVFVFIFSYWLFFCVRIYERRHQDYELTYLSIVQFALSLVDSLLFIHYMAVILVEIRQLQPQYYVKIVRSPDGQSRSYAVGQLSIQRAAVWMLEKYYQDFPIYNPYLETVPSRHRKQQQQQQQAFKVYDVDGVAEEDQAPLNQTVLPGRRSGHNDRFYEEYEYERRVRKRRARLISAAEEAFTHIKRMQDENGPAIPMDPTEAAQAIFPSMARALQKYLRITRQQPRHTMQGILEHLSQCLHYDLSPKAFLEKYLQSTPVLQDDRELRPVQTWALVCDVLLSRPLKPGVTFLLRQGEVSLLVSIHALPHFNVTEEIVDPKSNRFVLRLNSETSV